MPNTVGSDPSAGANGSDLIDGVVNTHWPQDCHDTAGVSSWSCYDVFINWSGWPVAERGSKVDDADFGWIPDEFETLDAGERGLVGNDIEAYRLDRWLGASADFGAMDLTVCHHGPGTYP